MLGRTTATSYSADGLTTTETTPAGATLITTRHCDGSVLREYGTGQRETLTSYALPVSVPDEIAEMPFARCFKVTGSGEMPFIEDMSLLLTADGVAYYALENNESKIAKAQEALRGAGFTVEINEAAPVSFQKDAGEVLFMATIS